MTNNIKDSLSELLKETTRPVKSIFNNRLIVEASQEDLEAEKTALLAPEEDLDISEEGLSSPSLDNYVFTLFCKEALLNNNCLRQLSQALRSDFTSDLKLNVAFTKGIKHVMAFYRDVVEDYNNRTITGIVKTTIDHIQSLEKNEITNKRSVNSAERLTTLFTNNKPRKNIHLTDMGNMPKDITNLCIAANIVNFTRILTLQTSYNNDLMSLRDIFKSPGENNKANKTFVSTLSDTELDKFYSKKHPNIFADYLNKFPWGNRTLTEASENSFSGVPGDYGKESDNEFFLLNCLVSYLIDLFQTGTPHPETIFNNANVMSIRLAAYEIDKLQSLETPNDKPAHWKAGEENTEDQDPDFNMSMYTDKEEAGTRSSVQDEAESPDLVAMEAFRDYVEELKKANNWDSENTLNFLIKTLKAEDGSDGLSEILKRTIVKLPGTVYNEVFTFPVISNNSIESINLLEKLSTLTLSSNFMHTIANLAKTVSNLSTYRQTKNESHILNLINSFSLLEATKGMQLGLEPEDINILINDLPKTLETAIAGYNILRSKDGGYTVYYNNKAAETVNRLYDALISKAPLFSDLSTNIINQVPPEGLIPGGTLQSSLGVSIAPKKSATPLGLTNKERASGQISVRVNKSADLELLWNVYYTAIKDIVEPTINVQSWGLLNPTRLSPPGDPGKAIGVLYYTLKVPKGSKSGSNLIKALFDSPGDFTPIREQFLQTLRTLKPRFLAATTLNDIRTLLQELLVVLGPASKIKFFSSPDTQTCPQVKKSPLYSLIDPKLAITQALTTVEKTRTFSEQHLVNNPFTDLISNILVLNTPLLTNSVIINTKLDRLFEDNNDRVSNLDLVACDVAINTQIRARILLAVVSFMELLESILTILREIIVNLHTIVSHLFGEEASSGSMSKFFDDISAVLAGAIPKLGSDSPESLSSYIKLALSHINNRFAEYEERAKKVAALKQKQPTYTGKLYGSID